MTPIIKTTHKSWYKNLAQQIKFFFTGLIAFTTLSPVFANESLYIDGHNIRFNLESLTSDLNAPWSMAFLPDGGILITERTGDLHLYKDGKISAPFKGVPEVFAKSQGGLFDVLLHPDFSENRRLFLSFAFGDDQANGTRIVSAQLAGLQLTQVTPVFTVAPLKDTPVHYGGRMALLADNTLLLTTGDGFDYREKAQDLNNLLGKVIRINLDGSIPADNPFKGSEQRAEIYSYGHRNPQGILFDKVRQQIILHEHGPAGGDEINFIQPGKNYGWPVITHGKDYSGASISPYTEYPGMEQPLLHWTPSIAPSGIAVYYGDQFKELTGSLLVGALAGKELRLVYMKNNQVVEQASLLKEHDLRIRDVRVGPDGAIYLLTDSEQGQLLRLTRAENFSQ